MKKYIGILLIALMITSCTNEKDDLKYQGYEYTVIDTTHISRNGLNAILGYDLTYSFNICF